MYSVFKLFEFGKDEMFNPELILSVNYQRHTYMFFLQIGEGLPRLGDQKV